MKVKGSRRLVKRLGLALAVAAVFAPGAQAVPIGSNEGSTQARVYADDLVAPAPYSAIAPQQGRRYADDRHEASPVSGVPAERVRQYADDRHEPTPVTGGRTIVPQPLVVDDSTGFSWGDAGVGAAVSFALMLLGGGAIVATRHTRRGRLAAT